MYWVVSWVSPTAENLVFWKVAMRAVTKAFVLVVCLAVMRVVSLVGLTADLLVPQRAE